MPVFPITAPANQKALKRQAGRALGPSAIGLAILASAVVAQGQRGTGARASRVLAPRVRVEAAGYIHWSPGAEVDPSRGASTYWLHVSAADRGGKTSGGFYLDMPSRGQRLVAPLSAMDIDGVPSTRPGAATPPPAGVPAKLRLHGTCDYAGKHYAVQFDVVADTYKPGGTSRGKAAIARGSILMRMTPETGPKASSSATTVGRVTVQVWFEPGGRPARPTGT